MNKVIEQYMKNVRRCFPIYRKTEKIYLRRLKESVELFGSENINLSYDDLVEEFGSPSSVASEYFRNVDNGDLIKALKRGKVVKTFISVSLVIIIVLWGVLCVWRYRDFHESVNDRIAYTEIYIEESEVQ